MTSSRNSLGYGLGMVTILPGSQRASQISCHLPLHQPLHPHVVTDDHLRLRWGHLIVLSSPLTNIAAVARHANHAHTQPQIEGERLILTQAQSTNVLVRFAEPVAAEAPVPKESKPADFHAQEVHLYVADPDGLLHALRPLTDETAV